MVRARTTNDSFTLFGRTVFQPRLDRLGPGIRSYRFVKMPTHD